MHLALWTSPHTQRVIGGGHVLISGAAGSGKSHLLREAIVPGLVASGAQVLVIDYADVIGAKIKGLRREVYGEETFGISNPNAASPAADLLGSSAIATLASQLATDLSRLKVGECLLGVPGAKIEKLKLNPWG